MTENVWTDERMATLAEMWGAGATAKAIANEIGVTRNAVIGKARRLNLGSHKHYQRPRKPKAMRVIKEKRNRSIAAKERTAFGRIIRGKQFKAAPKPFTGDAWQPLPGIVPVDLMALNAHTCRWPVGDPIFYCGAHVDGSVYCETHQQLSVRPAKTAEEPVEMEEAA